MRGKKINIKRSTGWIGCIDEPNLKTVLDKIRNFYFEKEKEEINLFITSNGGTTSAGFAFFDYVKTIFNPNLRTIGVGNVDSMAVIVFLTGKERIVTKDTTMYIHQVGRVVDAGERVTSMVATEVAKSMNYHQNLYAKIVSSNSNLKKKEVLNMMINNTLLTSKKMLEYGLVHKIIK